MIGRLFALSRSRPAQLTILGLAIGLMARAAFQSREAVSDGFTAAGPGALALAVACFAVGVTLAGLSWRQVLLGLGEEVRVVPALRIFCLSQLGKYLPGSVWVAMMSIELGHRNGLSRKSVGLGVVVASALGVVTGLAVGVPTLPFAIQNTDDVPWLFLLLGTPLLLLLVPRVLNWVLGQALRLARRNPLEAPLTGELIAKVVAWAAVSYLVQGLHLVVLVSAISDEPVPVIRIVSGFALAWTVGFLFLPAPAGAGVRELVLIAVLVSAVGEADAVAIAIISRAVTIVADIVLSVTAAGTGIRSQTLVRPQEGS